MDDITIVTDGYRFFVVTMNDIDKYMDSKGYEITQGEYRKHGESSVARLRALDESGPYSHYLLCSRLPAFDCFSDNLHLVKRISDAIGVDIGGTYLEISRIIEELAK